MTNHQATRQLRKTVASLRFEIETLFNKNLYVSGFVQFLADRGLNISELEFEYQQHVRKQNEQQQADIRQKAKPQPRKTASGE
jgi:glycine cleavage system regulatory protein